MRELRTALVVLLLGACGGSMVEDASRRPAGPREDLAERVERLRREIDEVPTDADNYMDRLLTLEAWWNDLALRGELRIWTITAAHFYFVRAPRGFTDETPRWIRQATKILSFVEDHGDRNGQLRRVDDTELVVNQLHTVALEYTVGDVEIPAGGALRVGQLFTANRIQRLQVEDPSAGAWVSFEVVSASAETEPFGSPWQGVFSDLFRPTAAPALRVTEGALTKGDRVLITLGDRSRGGPGLRMTPRDADDFRFVVQLDPDGDGVFGPGNFTSVQIVGGEPARLALVGPSVVSAGEPFSLRLRVDDRYGSPARFSGDVFTVMLRDREMGRIAVPPGESVGSLEGLRIEEPGGYKFGVQSSQLTLEALSNPILVEEAPSTRVFWGELHGHSGLEEGTGTVARYYEYARDYAFLDFASLTGHDIFLAEPGWREIRRETAMANRPGRFVSFMGYEWTRPYTRGGHHNVFFAEDPGRYPTFRQAPELEDLYSQLEQISGVEGALVIPHAHDPGDWTTSDPSLERLVEMYSMHGSFEYFGKRYLDNGFRVGLIAASDDHTGHPGNAPATISTRGGLAAVYAPALERGAIWKALRSRATYATSGGRPVLRLSVEGESMGGALEQTSRPPVFQVRALGESAIDHIDVIRNGRVEHRQDYLAPREGGEVAIQVMFHARTDPGTSEPRPPLQALAWRGWLEVEGAELAAVEPIGLDHFTDVVRQVGRRRVWFALKNRGDFDGALLRFTGPPDGARLRIDVVETLERDGVGTAGSQGLVEYPGPPPDEPVHSAEFRIGPVGVVPSAVELASEGEILVRRVRPRGDWDVVFDYRPRDPPVTADYYYLRLVEIDGVAAWTSPVWIGED